MAPLYVAQDRARVGVSQDRRAAEWEKLSESLPARSRRVEDEDVPRIQIRLMIRKDSVLRYHGTIAPATLMIVSCIDYEGIDQLASAAEKAACAARYENFSSHEALTPHAQGASIRGQQNAEGARQVT